MQKYIYKGSNYGEMLLGFASSTGVQARYNQISMPESVASGFTRWAELPGGLSAMVSDCEYVNDFVLQRQPGAGDFYVLQFDWVTGAGFAETAGQPATAMYFFRPDCGWQLQRKKGMRVRSVKIIIPHNWLRLYISDASGLIAAFEQRYAAGIFSAQLPGRLQMLLNSITSLPNAQGASAIYMQNRVMVMLEDFFNRFHAVLTNTPGAERLNRDYVSRVRAAAGQLALHVAGSPPSLGKLASAAAMSVTSFKKYFKLVFGKPVYQYYLGLRLAHGRRLLAGGSHTVKDVAGLLGYTSVHHFSNAYAREFGVNPLHENNNI